MTNIAPYRSHEILLPIKTWNKQAQTSLGIPYWNFGRFDQMSRFLTPIIKEQLHKLKNQIWAVFHHCIPSSWHIISIINIC